MKRDRADLFDPLLGAVYMVAVCAGIISVPVMVLTWTGQFLGHW